MTDFNVLGDNLFGEPLEPDNQGEIKKRFIMPPFSVLSARDGLWQDRKRAWIALGIQSELGRGENSSPSGSPRPACDYSKKERGDGAGKSMAFTTQHKLSDGTMVSEQTGTSIFDPVLTELMYKWFCPAGGQIVDPFAGGSVRGVVASKLGYRYWGCDLSSAQIQANRVQGRALCGDPQAYKTISVSAPMLKQLFNPCEPDYIKEVCKGRCCEKSDGGVLITIHPVEKDRIENLGGVVIDGFLQAVNGKCPFKRVDGLCKIHEEKPFGCKASPFTLNSNSVLIVRNRYRCMGCYKTADAVPAYIAHRWSLNQIFGECEAQKIAEKIIAGDAEITAKMNTKTYNMLLENDTAKHGKDSSNSLQWVHGDSIDKLKGAPLADFVFSCPPYGDLEVYSDDPRDLSTMEYHTFIPNYKRIIMRACARLKENRFACFVVGDFRDKKTGNYRNFVSDTIAGFLEQGLHLYNEAILVTAVGSLPIRINKQFEAGRKMGKTHQNILVFVKGDGKKATKNLIAKAR